MKKKFLFALGGASLLIAAAFAGMSIAGSSAENDRAPTMLKTVDAVAAAPGSWARPAGKPHHHKVKKPAITTYYGQDLVVPAEQEGVVQGLRCPKGTQPISGGASTQEGIVTSYLSHIRPSTGKTSPRTYFIGVDDNSGSNGSGSGAIIEVQCAKNISVKY